MSDRSAIEWTEATGNPVTGCSKVSPGCAHCYAEIFAERWGGVAGPPYEQGFDLRLWPGGERRGRGSEKTRATVVVTVPRKCAPGGERRAGRKGTSSATSRPPSPAP